MHLCTECMAGHGVPAKEYTLTYALACAYSAIHTTHNQLHRSSVAGSLDLGWHCEHVFLVLVAGCSAGVPEIKALYLEPPFFPVVTREQLRAKAVVVHCVVDFKCSNVTIFEYSVGVAIDGDVPCVTNLPADSVKNIHNATNILSRHWRAKDIIDPDGDAMFTVQCFIVGHGCPCNDVINNKNPGQYSSRQLIIGDSKLFSRSLQC